MNDSCSNLYNEINVMNSKYQSLSTVYSNLNYNTENNLTNNTIPSQNVSQYITHSPSLMVTTPSYNLNINNNISYNDTKETNYLDLHYKNGYFVNQLMQNSNQNQLSSFEKISNSNEILQILQILRQFDKSLCHPKTIFTKYYLKYN